MITKPNEEARMLAQQMVERDLTNEGPSTPVSFVDHGQRWRFLAWCFLIIGALVWFIAMSEAESSWPAFIVAGGAISWAVFCFAVGAIIRAITATRNLD